MSDKFQCWVVRLRHPAEGQDDMVAEVMRDYLAFNTMKFMSHGAALAHCRKNRLDPLDHVICRAEFTSPTILDTHEIDYTTTELAVAVRLEQEA